MLASKRILRLMQKSTAARVPCGAVRCSTSSLELLRAQPRTTDDDKVFAAQRGTRQPHRLTAARRRRRSESATFYATATLPISPWITSRPFALSTGPLLEPDTSVSREFFNQGERPRGLRPRPHEPGRTRRVRRRPLTPLPRRSSRPPSGWPAASFTPIRRSYVRSQSQSPGQQRLRRIPRQYVARAQFADHESSSCISK